MASEARPVARHGDLKVAATIATPGSPRRTCRRGCLRESSPPLMSCVAMGSAPIMHVCAVRAIDAARHIRDVVQAMPPAERGPSVDAILKPGAAITMQVDRTAEKVGIAALERLAAEVGHRIHLIADVARAQVLELGQSAKAEIIYAMLDAVDGTIKVGGL